MENVGYLLACKSQAEVGNIINNDIILYLRQLTIINNKIDDESKEKLSVCFNDSDKWLKESSMMLGVVKNILPNDMHSQILNDIKMMKESMTSMHDWLENSNGNIVDMFITYTQQMNEYNEKINSSVKLGIIEYLDKGNNKENLIEFINFYQLTESDKEFVVEVIDEWSESKKNEKAEQASIEDKKGNENFSDSDVIDVEYTEVNNQQPSSDSIEQTQQEVRKQEKPTPNVASEDDLLERLKNIKYDPENYRDILQQTILDYKQQSLLKTIQMFEEKKNNSKLSFKEAVSYHQAIEEQKNLLELQEMLANDKGNISKDIRTAKVHSKLSAKEEKLNDLQSRENNSKLFKYISSKREGRLNKKISELNDKMLIAMNEQIQAELVTFDKSNNKIVRSAKWHARKEALTDVTKAKIEQLKEMKNNLVEKGASLKKEVTNIAKDIKSRFVRKGNDITSLSNSNIVISGVPAIIENNENSLVATR